MSPRRILYVISHAPQRGALPRELLDSLLVGAVFDQNISVLFMADGVYQLLDTGRIDGNIARSYRALPTYDVDALYADRAALRARGLSIDDLALPVQDLTRSALRRLFAAQDVVLND